MGNISRWTGFPACWAICLKSAPINYKLVNGHFRASVLEDTTCSHNWISDDGGWFLKGDHITHSRAGAVALKVNAWGIATFLHSSGGFQNAQHAPGLAVWSAHMQFPADLHCLVVWSFSPTLYCQAVSADPPERRGGFWWREGPTGRLTGRPVIPKHSPCHRVQMRSELPEGNRMSTSSDIPRRHYSSIENDQIGSSPGLEMRS